MASLNSVTEPVASKFYFFVLDKNRVLIAFDPNQHKTFVHFYGVARIKTLRGTCSILGHILGPGSPAVLVHSPRSHAFLSILWDSSGNEDYVGPLDQYPCIVEMESVPNDTMLKMQQFASLTLVPNVHALFDGLFFNKTMSLVTNPGYSMLAPTSSTFYLFDPHTHQHTESLLNSSFLTIPPTWPSLINSIVNTKSLSTPLRLLVCGDRKIGKSTLVRYLTNALQSKLGPVILVDFDVGQTELCAPGIVSAHQLNGQQPLLGSPLCHQRVPEWSAFYGALSPSDSPRRYLIACDLVWQRIQKTILDNPRISLVINTMGWTSGLGLECLKFHCQLVRPTHLVYISNTTSGGGADASKTFSLIEQVLFEASTFRDPFIPHLTPLSQSVQVAIIQSIVNNNAPNVKPVFSPADLRFILQFAYFHGKMPSEGSSLIGFKSMNPLPLTKHVPYTAILGTRLKIVNCINPEFNSLEHINGCIVALVDKTQRCLGLGLVRGIDPQTRRLFLLSPLPMSVMGTCTELWLGQECAIPSYFMLEDDEIITHNYNARNTCNDPPFLDTAINYDALGLNPHKVRRNLIRIKELSVRKDF